LSKGEKSNLLTSDTVFWSLLIMNLTASRRLACIPNGHVLKPGLIC